MNQTVYKCIKCNSQFCREIDERKKIKNVDVRCPSCGNQYVIEIQNNSKNVKSSPPKPLSVFLTGTALSAIAGTPSTSRDIEKKQSDDDSIEIPKTNHSFSSIESAFDSNQSVAGSSVEVLSECSSQVSHASQSSIEVIDPFGSRKPSEERRISTAPSLDTIDDDQIKHEENVLETTLVDEKKPTVEESNGKTVLGNTNLTESSSSGESVQTAYEQNGKKKHEEEKSSPLESIFKTSSILLSKSVKKEPEPVVTTQVKPMQYNYDNLSILDHRLKLYCFQHVLEDNDEKVMWLIKCIVVEEDLACTPRVSLLIMSTKKIYVLKIIGEESEEISNWLQKSSCSNFISQIEKIQELFFENGLTFIMRNSLNFHVLLRDENLANVLKKHITTSSE
jgi:DNA-directed RNA polymerase subunit RPC12/RpoP